MLAQPSTQLLSWHANQSTRCLGACFVAALTIWLESGNAVFGITVDITESGATFQKSLTVNTDSENEVWKGTWTYQGLATAMTKKPKCDKKDPESGKSMPTLVDINPDGMNESHYWEAVCDPDADSTARSTIKLAKETNTKTLITQEVSATARAEVTDKNPKAKAAAGTLQIVRITKGLKREDGEIRWNSEATLTQSYHIERQKESKGNPIDTNAKDPIDFQVFDTDTGEILLEDRLLNIEASIFADPDFAYNNFMSWNTNVKSFNVNAFNANFSIEMSSPFTIQQGILFLEIRGGLVTRSDDTGIFDGLLPAVGSPGVFSMPLDGITLDYDLGDSIPFGTRNLSIGFSFNASDQAFAIDRQVIPLPAAAWMGLSLLGGTAAVSKLRRKLRNLRN